LLFSIALAVGLTPQLLPAIINVNLSRGSQAITSRLEFPNERPRSFQF
jgi:Mg2+-importing ATPase